MPIRRRAYYKFQPSDRRLNGQIDGGGWFFVGAKESAATASGQREEGSGVGNPQLYTLLDK